MNEKKERKKTGMIFYKKTKTKNEEIKKGGMIR